jgi:hypothetical protein
MSIIFHIMKEEHQRLLEAERVYLKHVKREVKGSPRIKRFGKKDYLYVEKREGPKVVYDYVGPANSEKALKVLESIMRRRKDADSLKKVRNDLKDVKKVLRGKI